MPPLTVLILLGLFTKHFFLDFPLQPKYKFKREHYIHPEGAFHAGLHSLLTYIILWYMDVPNAGAIALVEALIHYHLDYCVNRMMSYHLNVKEQFWLLGVDQYFHALTYIGIIYYITEIAK